MAGTNWSDAVEIAVRRLAARTGSAEFTRQDMIAEELQRIVNETGSRGATPEMTLNRELQQLRDRGEIEFLGSGHYRLRNAPLILPRVSPTRCVFVIGSHSIYEDEPDRFYRFPQRWLNAAARSVGQGSCIRSRAGLDRAVTMPLRGSSRSCATGRPKACSSR